MQKGSNTRSGLLWEVERLLNECDELPQVLLMENVPQVHSKKNMSDFQKWIDFHKAESVNSNTQLYKQAGNSIVENVLVAILGQLFDGKEEVYKNI